MEMVITIPDEIYKKYMDDRTHVTDVLHAVRCGTPLPKEHGRLKDINAFITKVKADRKHSAYLRSWTADDVLNALDNSYAPIIIGESDSE